MKAISIGILFIINDRTNRKSRESRQYKRTDSLSAMQAFRRLILMAVKFLYAIRSVIQSFNLKEQAFNQYTTRFLRFVGLRSEVFKLILHKRKSSVATRQAHRHSPSFQTAELKSQIKQARSILNPPREF